MPTTQEFLHAASQSLTNAAAHTCSQDATKGTIELETRKQRARQVSYLPSVSCLLRIHVPPLLLSLAAISWLHYQLYTQLSHTHTLTRSPCPECERAAASSRPRICSNSFTHQRAHGSRSRSDCDCEFNGPLREILPSLNLTLEYVLSVTIKTESYNVISSYKM